MNTNLKLGLIIISMLTLCFGGATLATGCDAVKDALGDGGATDTDGGSGGGTDGGGTCTPACTDAVCGAADGCGGKCAGTCDEGKSCKQGVCVDDSCVAACTDKVCGEDDGCGTKCTACATAGETCNEDTWVCEAADACMACVQASCTAEFTTCSGNVDCVLIYQCVGACTDDTCVTDCYTAKPDGQADYDVVVACAQTNCPDECGGGTCEPTCGADSCGADDGCGDYCYDCSGANMSCNTTTWTCEDLGSCGGITFAGCCDGAVATFCENGAVQTIDCGANTDPAKKVCGWAAATDLGDIYDCGGAGEDPTGSNPILCTP